MNAISSKPENYTNADVRDFFLAGNSIRAWNMFLSYCGGWEWVYPDCMMYFDGPEGNYRIADKDLEKFNELRNKS